MHATTRRIAPRPWLRPRGFTLIELLVVIAIIGLISAVALPVVLPALNQRRVSEGARILQAALAGVRDSAIKANAPRGLRLLPDPVFGFESGKTGGPLASNRFIPIEPAPDYSEGVVQAMIATTQGPTTTPLPNPLYGTPVDNPLALRIIEQGYSPTSTGVGTLNAPTSWKYNIRQGDKLRFNDSGAIYTVAGPINGQLPNQLATSVASDNPDHYICFPAAYTSPAAALNASQPKWIPEYLYLTNGIDDDGDGWVDESCDGIDNDGDGVIDPGFNGIDDDGDGTIDNPAELWIGLNAAGKQVIDAKSEFEQEVFVGTLANNPFMNENYTISRRPVVSPGGAETTLPAGVVIDLTTWNAAAAGFQNAQKVLVVPLPERSRLPVNPFNGYVDLMLDQTGRVVATGAGGSVGFFNNNSPIASLPFYHFWIADREDVVAPLFGITSSPSNPVYSYPNRNTAYESTPPHVNFLPMPQGTVDSAGNPYTGTYLKGERRLVTLFTKTGQIVSNSIELFNQSDTSTPYYAPQSGVKESQ